MSTWETIDTARAERMIDEADGPVRFLIPRHCQGQTVEYSYAGIGADGIMRQTHDRSDGTTTYAIRDWTDEDEDYPGLNFEPA